MFQQEQMQEGHKNLSPEEYKSFVKGLSATWKSMSEENKAVYKVQAEHQQSLRNRLAEIPLASKTDKANVDQDREMSQSQTERQELEEQVSRKGRQKISARRLALNHQAEKDHPLWTSATQYGDSYLFQSDILQVTST